MGRANGPHACSLVTFPSPSAWPLRGVYGSRCGGRIEYSQLTGGVWRSRIRVLVANSLGPTEARSQQARRADATSGRRGGAHRRFGPVDDLYTERANGTDDQ